MELERFAEQLFFRSSLKDEKRRLDEPREAIAGMWVVNKLSEAVESSLALSEILQVLWKLLTIRISNENLDRLLMIRLLQGVVIKR